MNFPLTIKPKSILTLPGCCPKDSRTFFAEFLVWLKKPKNYKPCIKQLDAYTGWGESAILFHLHATPKDCIEQYSKQQANNNTLTITSKYGATETVTLPPATLPPDTEQELPTGKKKQYKLFDITDVKSKKKKNIYCTQCNCVSFVSFSTVYPN